MTYYSGFVPNPSALPPADQGGVFNGGGSGVGAYDYVVLQNAAGTVYTAYDRFGNVVTTNSTPDIGPVLNTLITKLVNSNVGGTIFMGPGQFILQANWVQDGSGNYYVVGIPFVPLANYGLPIRIFGSGAGAFGNIYTGSTVWTSPLAATGTQIYFQSSTPPGPSAGHVFWAIPSAALNWCRVELDGIRFTQSSNSYTASVNMIDLQYASAARIGTLAVDTYAANTSVMPLPTAYGTGLTLPQVNSQGPFVVNDLYVAGYYQGISVSEHLACQSYYAQACRSAVSLNNGQPHASTIDHALFQQCPYWINPNGNPSQLSILMLDGETKSQGGTNAWQSYTAVSTNGNTVVGDFWVMNGPNSPNTLNLQSALGTLPPGGRWHTVGLGYSPSSLTAGASPYTSTLLYDAIYVITTVGGMTALTLDGQALFNGAFSVGQQILVPANHPLKATWATTAPVFEILPI